MHYLYKVQIACFSCCTWPINFFMFFKLSNLFASSGNSIAAINYFNIAENKEKLPNLIHHTDLSIFIYTPSTISQLVSSKPFGLFQNYSCNSQPP